MCAASRQILDAGELLPFLSRTNSKIARDIADMPSVELSVLVSRSHSTQQHSSVDPVTISLFSLTFYFIDFLRLGSGAVDEGNNSFCSTFWHVAFSSPNKASPFSALHTFPIFIQL